MPQPTVSFGAVDVFSANANFEEQDDSSILNETSANMLDSSGNSEVETTGLNTTTEYSVSYKYKGVALATDLGTLLTKFGDVHGSGKVTALSINFRAGDYPTVTVTGHNHTENAHTAQLPEGYADVSAAVPASAGFGVPTPTGQTWGANATGQSLTISFSCQHVDREDYAGNHFVGKNITVRAEMSMEWLGTPTTPDATGWTLDSKGDNDANTDYEGYVYTAHRYFDLATA